jgi:hypothetical protein
MWLRAYVALAALALVAAGCSLGGSSHPTLSYGQAVKRAQADGFLSVRRQPRATYICTGHAMSIGAKPLAGGRAPGVPMRYGFSFTDRRAPPVPNRFGVVMLVLVFSKPGYAAHCAASGLYGFRHTIKGVSKNGTTIFQPSRRISADILYVRGLGYDTWVARGDAIGLGQAGNAHDIRLVEADLARLTAQMSG